MKNTQGEMENMMLSAEHEEQEDKQSEEDGEEEKEESEDEDVEPEDGGDDEDVKPKAKPQGKDGKVAPPAKAKNKKESDVLNLNNEVVKMRKEVKRVRALTIRKLTRQIVALKNKKGKEAVVEKNQRRAARLLEELHAMKELVPDLVTKTALQKNLSFEIVCKNPKSTISDRAMARIASHPQFNKKIETIKAAVKAFKDERRKGGKQAEREKVQTQPAEASQQPADKTSEREIEKKEEAIAATPRKAKDDGVKVMEDTDDAAVGETEEEVCSDAPERSEPKSEEPVEIKTRDVKQTESTQIESQDAKKPPSPKPAAAEPQRMTDDDVDDESDLESSGDEEEKEYFDDSTEERFHKQSSQSEESDDDDFFVGKVSKFKKKKPKAEGEELKEEVKKGSEKPSDQLQSQLDELESRLKSKGKAFQSVFCSSLGGAKAGRGGGPGRGRGRGGDRFRGPKGGGGPSREFSQQSKYQRGSESSSLSKYSKPCPEARHQESGEKGGRGRGRGRGRGDAFRQKDPRGFSHQAPRQVLHPSWEASKKRKEQQGQILAFQGKRIKFDDDD